jgi:hypothetical protein
MDPVPPLAARVRFAGAGTGALTAAPPAVTAVGLGEGTGATTKLATEDLFHTVMVNVVVHPEPMLVGAGASVISSAFHVQGVSALD